ncbi:MAG TPA: alpha/beta hydrolase, partial [Cytophagales bacterium]|nr:alpha/beta hydrolase [Cytophagales bacterium]
MRGGHLETIVPSLRRKVPVPYVRERITTPDDDFLDLDWLRQDSDRLVVVTHGLEGSSDRHHAAGTAKALFAEGWDVCAWNCRSCSGEMNRQFRLYHHGETGDIHTVIQHALAQRAYRTVALVGYSMGGSIALRYLADFADQLHPSIKTGIAVSTPTDLKSSALELEKRGNGFYRRRFLRKLSKKLYVKAEQYPGRIDVERLAQVKTFEEFDTYFSAPMFGLRDADDFYATASVGPRLPQLTVPSLLLNAANDPMLSESCYPTKLAKTHPYLHLEIPTNGGHTGFWRPGEEYTFADKRIVKW